MVKSGKKISIIGGGLAGCEAALHLARLGQDVSLYEMRDIVRTPVHKGDLLAELVCSNSFKSTKKNSAAGLLKQELISLNSPLFKIALDNQVPAGGALAVDRDKFALSVTKAIEDEEKIKVIREEVTSLEALDCDAIIVATGPMTSPELANNLASRLNDDYLNFYDAAAPIVEACTIDESVVFASNRYEGATSGDYLNCPLNKEEYEHFINELLNGGKVILKEFEKDELFNACQPIEEIARSGFDAPRFGPMKPVGLIDPRDGKRPHAVVQLRSENTHKSAYNLVGFQTNLTFCEQKRIFRMIPGLENAEFVRYGVMHKNIFIDSPRLLDSNSNCLKLSKSVGLPVYVAGQLCGTEGYVEAIRSGFNSAISLLATLFEIEDLPLPPNETVFGALLNYVTDVNTKNYQPMHVNFGIMPPLPKKIRKKEERYEAYANRANFAMSEYASKLKQLGIL